MSVSPKRLCQFAMACLCAAVFHLLPVTDLHGQEDGDAEPRKVEVLLKTGRTIVGDLVRDAETIIVLRTGSSRVRIYKFDIETIDGKPVFGEKEKTGPSDPGEIEPEEVLIPAGEFLMGDSRGDDRMLHTAVLKDYAIDRYEVTNDQYAKFLEATGRKPPKEWTSAKYNAPRQPVVGVTWQDAADYCAWAGKRLPTEAEWEKAARGPDGLLYPWGDGEIDGMANTREAKLKRSLPVGSYATGRSPYGIMDMAGNVWEWVADWYDEDYYQNSPTENPTGPEEGKEKVIRGGGWNISMVDMSYRKKVKPNATYPSLGFRCVRDR